jgi:4-hydroxybenzoate polyprenyltransferase
VLFLLDLPANPTPFIVGCVTFTIYVNDRLVDIDADTAANPGRTSFVRRHSRSLSAVAAVAYGVALMLAVYGGPKTLALTLFPAIVWVLYAVDWAPVNAIPFQRLKELLVINSTLVAAAWASTVVLLPVVYAGAAITPSVLLLVAYFAVGTFMGAEIANVGDVEADRKGNVATLPSTFGIRATRYALYLVGIAGLALLGGGLASGYLGVHAMLALAVGLACMLGVVALLGRVDDSRVLSIAGECARLPILVVLLAPGTIV